MQIQRTESPGWLSNAYLIDDRAGTGVLIDGNGIVSPLLDAIDERGLQVPALLLTHHHPDHVVLDRYRGLGPQIHAHPLTAAEIPGVVDTVLADGHVLDFGGLSIESLHTPGRAHSHLSFVVNATDVSPATSCSGGQLAALGRRRPRGSLTCVESLERLVSLDPSFGGLTTTVRTRLGVRLDADGEEAIVGGSQVGGSMTSERIGR